MTNIWAGVSKRTDKYTGFSYEVDYTDHRARLISMKEITDILNFNEFSAFTDSYQILFYLDGKKKTTEWGIPPADITNKSNYAWLFDYTDCEEFGCKNIDSNHHGYFTSDRTFDNTNYAWYVREKGFVECTWVNEKNWAGIRPVITVEKEKLKY